MNGSRAECCRALEHSAEQLCRTLQASSDNAWVFSHGTDQEQEQVSFLIVECYQLWRIVGISCKMLWGPVVETSGGGQLWDWWRRTGVLQLWGTVVVAKMRCGDQSSLRGSVGKYIRLRVYNYICKFMSLH